MRDGNVLSGSWEKVQVCGTRVALRMRRASFRAGLSLRVREWVLALLAGGIPEGGGTAKPAGSANRSPSRLSFGVVP